jgi:HSP20 family protein
MAVATYDPFVLMNQFQNEVNRLFDARAAKRRGGQSATASGDWAPPVDIQEEANQYVINADIPGVDPKDIEVTMEKGVLTLRGSRASQTSAEKNGYTRRERPVGSFYRSFVMPDTADAEGITAQGKNGVLQVLIPKRQKAQARRIQVEG